MRIAKQVVGVRRNRRSFRRISGVNPSSVATWLEDWEPGDEGGDLGEIDEDLETYWPTNEFASDFDDAIDSTSRSFAP